ncbi:MAG: ComF family protein [Chloroflexota bacterium]|nr:ComF family protein [Chloroflexota bacterium]
MPIIETIGLHWCDFRNQLLDLLFPPHCVGCRRVGAWLCADCLVQIPRVEPPFCARCGGVVVADGLCARCQTAPLQIECIRSAVYFEGVLREAIHQLKYYGRTVLAAPLGGLMVAWWMQHPMPADVVVPVPLHIGRLRERGYNQAALLAREMARRVGLVVEERTLVRWRMTAPQVELDTMQRKENVRDAFSCSGDTLAGKQVLLIDDVCTTGATLESCAVALYEGGAQAVRALTLARAC